jgi:RimJ/RimL family protein N-acetyltransferase
MPQQVVTTTRLRLRPPTLADAPAIHEGYAQDPEVTRHLIWRPHKSLAETEAFLRSAIEGWAEGTLFQWVITRADDGAVIGMLAARIEDGFKASVGYVLARAEWGKGYVPEALRAVIEVLWSQPGIFRIWAVCDVENAASARVLEKVGMEREGRLGRFILHPNISPEPRDVFCYATVRS